MERTLEPHLAGERQHGGVRRGGRANDAPHAVALLAGESPSTNSVSSPRSSARIGRMVTGVPSGAIQVSGAGSMRRPNSMQQRIVERGELSPEETHRLAAVQAELDQCWDLLRQRRAKREFGDSPSDAHARPADVVKKYIG